MFDGELFDFRIIIIIIIIIIKLGPHNGVDASIHRSNQAHT